MAIKIKSHFGNWKEVSKEEALKFAKNFAIGAKVGFSWESFDKHIQGLDYEEVRNAVDPFYKNQPSRSSRGAGSTNTAY